MHLKIQPLSGRPVDTQPVEMVERKGLGHPDTICDILAENLSKHLCRFYQEHFGLVLHHNVDKGLLFGGRSRPAFGGGEVLEPMEVYLVGRATMSHRGTVVPIEELAVETTRQWFRKNFHALDPERHLRIHCLLRPGSQELTELYLRQAATGIALANDTSCGVGYAPLDTLETVVLAVEQYLNRPKMHRQFPAYGQDIKIMGLRTGDNIELTVACAFIDRYLHDNADYLRHKEKLAELVVQYSAEICRLPVVVFVNTGDNPDSDSLYLTVTGTSGEAGDDGEVGRGNRANGLITPYRPMNMEAVAGKNPVTHVGKIYNLAAGQMAERLVGEIEEVQEAYCFLVSQIGKPVRDPRIVEVRLRLQDESLLSELGPVVNDIAEATLTDMQGLWQRVVGGTVSVC
jgi:S-adenosylmethionine synthetase